MNLPTSGEHPRCLAEHTLLTFRRFRRIVWFQSKFVRHRQRKMQEVPSGKIIMSLYTPPSQGVCIRPTYVKHHPKMRQSYQDAPPVYPEYQLPTPVGSWSRPRLWWAWRRIPTCGAQSDFARGDSDIPAYEWMVFTPLFAFFG